MGISVYRYDYDEGDILYEFEVYDHQGEGDSVQWFQQYKDMPLGSAEISLANYLSISVEPCETREPEEKEKNNLTTNYKCDKM